MVTSPPAIEGGYMPQENWVNVLNKLVKDPSPKTLEALDRHLADTGLTALGILKTLNPAAAIAAEKTGHIGPEQAAAAAGAPAAAATAAAAPAPAAAPARPEPAAPPAGETPEQRRERYQTESAADIRRQEEQAESETARGRSQAAEAFEAVGRANVQRIARRAEFERSQREKREREAAEQHLQDMQRHEELLADNIRTYRQMQENRNSEPGDRELAARRADKLQAELDAAKAERERLRKAGR